MRNSIVLPFLLACFLLSAVLAQAQPEALRVNYQTNPLGMDVERPRFSWQMSGNHEQSNQYQTAYQIMVSQENGEKVWDSGKVNSSISLGIAYAGKSLQPTTRYDWTLTVWDQDEQATSENAWFETGLMNPDPGLSAWDGASWIGGSDEDMVLHSHYLSVFRFQYNIQFDQASGSTKAAFVFGANDTRLMNKHLNLLGVENGTNESYVALELDISTLGSRQDELAKLHIYRVGYTPDDGVDIPFQTLDIPKELINENNKYEQHQLHVEAVFGIFEIYLNGKEARHLISPKPATPSPFAPKGINLNPYGSGNDFICFPMLADIGFLLDAGQKAQFSKISIRHFRQPSNAVFSELLKDEQNYQGIFKDYLNSAGGKVSISNEAYVVSGAAGGAFIVADPSRNAAPMLRTEFKTADREVQKARLYVTARGIYEMYMNGQRIGKDYFNPGLTQYNKTHLYQTYDVTEIVRQGNDNTLGAWLSEGWWSGNITFKGENWNYFGDRQSLLCKLVLTYADGTQEIVTSNPANWKIFTDGPIRYGSFFQGEAYDARREDAIADWTNPGYDDSSWKPAVNLPLDGTAVTGSYTGFAGRQVDLSYDQQKLIGQIGENVEIIKTLTAQSVEEVRPGVYVYDMGQNMVGFPRLQVDNSKQGQVIRMRYSEVKYPNLPEYATNTDMIMLENIRAALAQDIYLSRGGAAIIQPRFTFHGYRFLEITGIEEAIPLEKVQGLVLSSVRQLDSKYETSNPLVNKLWENITWSLRGNFLSIPTDTPARNERMGWNGDINVFGRAATYLTNANQFLKRHLRAMRDMQSADGRFSDVAPVGNGFGGTLWGSAGITVAWEAYQQYGDLELLREHYDAMKRYLQFLDGRIDEQGVLVEGPLGDWLSPENAKNDNSMLWAAYHLYDLEIMAKVAALLDKEDDATIFRKRYEERKQFFNATYLDKKTGKTIKSGIPVAAFGGPAGSPEDKGKPMDTQASYAIPLAFDLFEEENKPAIMENFANTISRQNVDDSGAIRPPYSLMTGFIGTASIGEALSENGRDDLAYRLLQQESYPSWLYPVINGATTIWERLNSYTHEAGFGGNNSMNSFNHYAFGAVASWMYNYSLGIQRDPAYPGFKQYVLKPTPDPNKQMKWAKGYYDSMYGRIISEWSIEEGKKSYRISVPPNTSARLYLQADELKTVSANGKKIRRTKAITYLGEEKGRLIFKLPSGIYEFEVTE